MRNGSKRERWVTNGCHNFINEFIISLYFKNKYDCEIINIFILLFSLEILELRVKALFIRNLKLDTLYWNGVDAQEETVFFPTNVEKRQSFIKEDYHINKLVDTTSMLFLNPTYHKYILTHEKQEVEKKIILLLMFPYIISCRMIKIKYFFQFIIHVSTTHFINLKAFCHKIFRLKFAIKEKISMMVKM